GPPVVGERWKGYSRPAGPQPEHVLEVPWDRQSGDWVGKKKHSQMAARVARTMTTAIDTNVVDAGHRFAGGLGDRLGETVGFRILDVEAHGASSLLYQSSTFPLCDNPPPDSQQGGSGSR